MHQITISSGKSKNYHGFEVVMHINALSRFLPQMKCDMRMSVITICGKVTGTATPIVVCCLLS